MCGVAGGVGIGSLESWNLCVNIQTHRGPDDRGLWEGVSSRGEPVFLGSRRLAILDLSPAGHMPMSTPDGKLTIAYNGEVYNCSALRSELEAKGHRFHSRSDTEVVLY